MHVLRNLQFCHVLLARNVINRKEKHLGWGGGGGGWFESSDQPPARRRGSVRPRSKWRGNVAGHGTPRAKRERERERAAQWSLKRHLHAAEKRRTMMALKLDQVWLARRDFNPRTQPPSSVSESDCTTTVDSLQLLTFFYYTTAITLALP